MTEPWWVDMAYFLALVWCASMSLVARSVAGTWAHPSPATALAWTIFLVLPMSVGLDPAPLTSLLISMVCTVVALSATISVGKEEVRASSIKSARILRLFVIFGMFSGGMAGALTLRANGISVGDTLTLSAINLAAQDATVLRYDGALSVPALATLLLAMTYGSALVAPFAASGLSGVRRILYLWGPTLGGGAFALATTARAGFLIAAMITAASWLIVTGVQQGGRAKMPAKALFGLALSGLALMAMFIYSALARVGGWSTQAALAMVDKIVIYSAGSIPAFEKWVHSETREGGLSFGAETLAGLSQFVSSRPGIGDAYVDRVDIGRGLSTNVYTILRPLTDDFGVAGAALAVGIGALIAAQSFRLAVLNRSILAAALCSTWLAVMLFASTTSILTFTNVCFGLFVAVALLATFGRIEPEAEGDMDTPVEANGPAGALRKRHSAGGLLVR